MNYIAASCRGIIKSCTGKKSSPASKFRWANNRSMSMMIFIHNPCAISFCYDLFLFFYLSTFDLSLIQSHSTTAHKMSVNAFILRDFLCIGYYGFLCCCELRDRHTYRFIFMELYVSREAIRGVDMMLVCGWHIARVTHKISPNTSLKVQQHIKEDKIAKKGQTTMQFTIY